MWLCATKRAWIINCRKQTRVKFHWHSTNAPVIEKDFSHFRILSSYTYLEIQNQQCCVLSWKTSMLHKHSWKVLFLFSFLHLMTLWQQTINAGECLVWRICIRCKHLTLDATIDWLELPSTCFDVGFYVLRVNRVKDFWVECNNLELLEEFEAKNLKIRKNVHNKILNPIQPTCSTLIASLSNETR